MDSKQNTEKQNSDDCYEISTQSQENVMSKRDRIRNEELRKEHQQEGEHIP